MGGASLTAGLALGAIMLAAWFDVRLGDARPADPLRRIGHALAALIVLECAVGALRYLDGAHAGQALLVFGLVGVFVPALAYAFLTGLWLLRTLVEAARYARR